MKKGDLIVGGIAIAMMAVVCAATMLTYEAAHADAFDGVVDAVRSAHVDRDESVRYEQLATLHSGQSENAAVEPQKATDSPIEAEVVYIPAYEAIEAYTASYSFETRGNPDGLNSFDGVFEHDGRTETYYSGDGAAYADRLWVDDDGFYRTESGHYAVAASDMPQGATFEGSQGTCEVVDSGCADGVTDYCVSGW